MQGMGPNRPNRQIWYFNRLIPEFNRLFYPFNRLIQCFNRLIQSFNRLASFPLPKFGTAQTEFEFAHKKNR